MLYFMKRFLVAWGIGSLVWLPYVVAFVLGNHDYKFVHQVLLSDGFFEGRFTQHLLTVVLFNGQVLPIFVMLCAIALLALTGGLSAIYLEARKYMIWFMMFLVLNPLNQVLFYYVYLILPWCFWICLSVIILLLFEQKNNIYGNIAVGIGSFLILGGYPPAITFCLILFIGRRLILFRTGAEDLKVVLVYFSYFLLLLIIGGIFYQIALWEFRKYGYIEPLAYNMATRSIKEMFWVLPYEGIRSISQFFQAYAFFEGINVFFYVVLVIGGCILYAMGLPLKQRVFGIMGLFLMFMTSRFVYIVAKNSEAAGIRPEYFGKLALMLFFLSVVLGTKRQILKNFWYFMFVMMFIFMAKVNYDIQKASYLGEKGWGVFLERVKGRLVEIPNFQLDGDYISFNFGAPKFKERYYQGKYIADDSEFLGQDFILCFDDVISRAFIHDEKQPVAIGGGLLKNHSLFFARRGNSERWNDYEYWHNNSYQVRNLGEWMYKKAEVYPHENSIYLDDKYAVIVFNRDVFMKMRARVLQGIDK